MSRKLAAEFIGTFWLVLGGCGAAVLAPTIGPAGIALAFGFALLTGALAFQHVSGAHFNPAVTLGLFAAKRLAGADVIAYWIAQTAGAIAAAALLFLIAHGLADFDTANGFALNGYGAHSPMHYPLADVLLTELALSFLFVIVTLGAMSPRGNASFAPVAMGLALALVYLVSMPVTNGAVNPARSTGVAVLAGGWAMDQLWVFWVTPLIGGGLAGLVQRWLD